jgi:tetratricopeptide (TPR) repeat protein
MPQGLQRSVHVSRWDKWFGFSKDEVFDEGMAAFDRGDFEAAVDAFHRCQRDCADGDELRLSRFYLTQSLAELGHERLMAGEAGNALNYFSQALTFGPGYPDLHLSAAKACHELGLAGDVDRHLERALVINPRFVDAIVFQGMSWYEQGLFHEAFGRLNYACQIDSHLDIERFLRAMQLHSNGDHDGALRQIRNLTCLSTADACLHQRLGDNYMREHRFVDAISEYKKAIDLSPDFADPYCRIGKAYLAVNMPAEASSYLEKCLRINETHADAHAQLSLAYKMLQKPNEARRSAETALKINPDHAIALGMRQGYVA